MKKAVILIDGSNFYFKLKKLNLRNLLHFNFSEFRQLISAKYKIVKTVYYIGAIKSDGSKKSQQMFSNQRKLLLSLKKHELEYSLGYLLKSGKSFHEKGVDVKIAVDILVAAYENLADHIVVVSSDTDLIPAINKAREKGKSVEYIGFAHQPSSAMIKNCSSYKLLTKRELITLLKK